jgi:hypothetical protein
MGIPSVPIFNVPLFSSLSTLVNNILETNTIKATIKAFKSITNPYLIWVLTIFNSATLYIIKTFNTVPVRLTKDLYYIDYFYEGKIYRIVFPIKSYNEINVVKVNSPFNDNSNITKYLGPNNNFHGSKITPNDIGCKNISITYFKEEDLTTITRTFSEDQVLSLN